MSWAEIGHNQQLAALAMQMGPYQLDELLTSQTEIKLGLLLKEARRQTICQLHGLIYLALLHMAHDLLARLNLLHAM